MKEKVPENLKFFVNYSSLFTEDLYNKLMEWCKNNSLGKPRDFNDTYEGLKRHRYFVFNNWGLNIRNKPSIEEIKNERGYGVDNNPQGCDFKYSIEDVKKLINYKTMQDKQIIGYKVKPQFIEAYKRLAGDSELQDIWCEPIYRKDEFKIGDWCYITYAQNSRLQAGKVYKINAVEVTSYGIRYHFDLDGRNNRSNSCWLPVDAFRKATPKEIKKAEVVEMPFGDEMMIVTGNSIKDRGGNVLSYGDMCEIFESLTRDLPYFEQYRLEIDKNSTIHLGCKKGTLLQIIGIVNKMNELRNED